MYFTLDIYQNRWKQLIYIEFLDFLRHKYEIIGV